MLYQNFRAFALATLNVGYQNQLRGALKAIADLTASEEDIEQNFLLPEGVASSSDIKSCFDFSSFGSYNEFRREIYKLIDAFLQKNKFVPQVFISIYEQTQKGDPFRNIDMLCKAVKDYYKQHELGHVMTAVLASPVRKYQYVDLINTPKHLLTFSTRIRLLRNKKLRKKVLITTGTINNFSRKNVKEKFKELSEILVEAKKNPELSEWLGKFDKFVAKSKKVVFCLGGRVEGSEIVFDLNYAKKIFNDAERLVQADYGVVFVNSQRTPNDVTDYFYEKAQQHPSIIFQNCKRIATEEEDRQPSKWRIYSGKNEIVFRKFLQIGNIYPAVLGFENTIVVHTMDSYSCCETANAAIPTAISGKGLYIDASVRYDCFNLRQLMCPKYAIDWDDFVGLACNMKIEPKNLNPQVLSNSLRVFAETIINVFNRMK